MPEQPPHDPNPADTGHGEPHRQAGCLPLGAGFVAAILAQHQRTTALHHQFLQLQSTFYDQLHPLLVAGRTRDLPRTAPAVVDGLLDPAIDTWLSDHCPTWTVPVLPGMSIADRLAQAAADYTRHEVVALRDVQIRRWLTVSGPVRLRTVVDGPPAHPTVTLSVWREAKTAALSRFAPVASGQVLVGERPWPSVARFAPLSDASPAPSPYDTAEMFHGPSFHYLVSLRTGPTGASGVLDLGRGRIPRGLLHPGPLDAAMHTIPGRSLWRWAPQLERGRFGFPHRIAALTVFDPLPDTGTIEVETRFVGFDEGNPALPVIDLQLCQSDRVLLAFRMVLILVPLGRFGEAPPKRVRSFLQDRDYVPDLLLSTMDGDATVLHRHDIDALDFVPGTVAAVYALPASGRGSDTLALVAAKEHVARHAAVHPGNVEVDEDLRTAWCAARPREIYHLDVTCAGDAAWVRGP